MKAGYQDSSELFILKKLLTFNLKKLIYELVFNSS